MLLAKSSIAELSVPSAVAPGPWVKLDDKRSLSISEVEISIRRYRAPFCKATLHQSTQNDLLPKIVVSSKNLNCHVQYPAQNGSSR